MLRIVVEQNPLNYLVWVLLKSPSPSPMRLFLVMQGYSSLSHSNNLDAVPCMCQTPFYVLWDTSMSQTEKHSLLQWSEHSKWDGEWGLKSHDKQISKLFSILKTWQVLQGKKKSLTKGTWNAGLQGGWGLVELYTRCSGKASWEGDNSAETWRGNSGAEGSWWKDLVKALGRMACCIQGAARRM